MSGNHSFASGVSRRKVLAGTAGVLGSVGILEQTAGAVDTDASTVADVERETRPVQIHPRWYWDARTIQQSRAAMQQWLDRAKRANVNVLFAWMESPELAAALGESRYASSSAFDFWDPIRWDAMGELISGAERRGMEVHLWYSFTRYKRPPGLIPEYDTGLEVLPSGDPDWASVRKSEYVDGYTDPADEGVSGTSLCVNDPDVRDWTFSVLERMLDRYPGLAGLHIEEPGYLELDRCVCHRCQDVYADIHGEPGENLLDHIYRSVDAYQDDPAAVSVKTHGTDAFVSRLADWWAARDNDGVLSFNGSWDPEWDRVRGRNWAVWSERGQLPYYLPQVYATDVDTFVEQTKVTMDGLSDTTILPMAGVGWSSGNNDAATVTDQIEAAEDLDGYSDVPVAGTSLFSGADFTEELALHLRAGPYLEPSRPTWRERSLVTSDDVGVVGDSTTPALIGRVTDANFDVTTLPGGTVEGPR